MAAALYNLAMSPAEAFDYTRGALQAAGMTLGQQSPPNTIEFSLTRKDVETVSLDVVMPGRAVIAPAADGGKSTVTIAVDPASQFILYAVGIGFAALIVGGWLINGNLLFLLVIGAEAYLFWAIFNKWPNEALEAIRIRMQASSAVTGGAPVVQPMAAPVFTQPAPPPQTPPKANAGDIATEIRHLAELRDQGLITAEEFEAKKTELLNRI
jgi:hypothetical protein